MKTTILPVLTACVTLAAACATPGAQTHWRKAGASSADFTTDNQSCGARATRVVPTPRPDQAPGGAVAPDNRMDQPPRPWTSAVAEGAYMDCMSERGWRIVQR
jgi:hypothetical protein